MEKKFLKEINEIALEALIAHREQNLEDYNCLINELYGALRCLKAVTGKEYVIHTDGTVEERR